MILQINPTILSSSTFVGRSHDILCAVGHWMLKRPPPEPDPNHLMMIAAAAAAISISIGMSQPSRGTSTTSSDATMSDTSRNQTFKKDALLKKIHKNLLLSSSAVYALVSLLGGILVIGVSQQCVLMDELFACVNTISIMLRYVNASLTYHLPSLQSMFIS